MKKTKRKLRMKNVVIILLMLFILIGSFCFYSIYKNKNKYAEYYLPTNIKTDDVYNENNMLNNLKKLPSSISEAVEMAENSNFIKKVLPDSFVFEFIKEKKKEIKLYNSCNDKDSFIKRQYFDVL